jgi:TP53 regulating kinase-like protein
MQSQQLIKQGAEARVYKGTFMNREAILKQRFTKLYRHPVLDQKITQKRLASESKNTVKARQLGVDTPALYHVDTQSNEIVMEYVPGVTVKQFLIDNHDNTSTTLLLAKCIGKAIATLHDGKIVHGDLTTSNMLLRENDPNQLVIIDFGLSFISTLAEDKAVDLYVLERAMLSTHPNSEQLFEQLLDGYKLTSKTSSQILAKLDQVRLRGRKRSMVG